MVKWSGGCSGGRKSMVTRKSVAAAAGELWCQMAVRRVRFDPKSNQ
jgi:hypothetical protein